MATFIQTNSCAGTPKPTNAGEIIRDAQYGIDATLSGYIIQNVTINTQRTYDETYDQKNALVSELDLDETQDLTMEIIGGSAESGALSGVVPGDTALEWDDKMWKVRSVTYNGAYNDKKRYTINLFRSVNWPSNS